MQLVIDVALAFSGSPTVQQWACQLITAVTKTCVSYFPTNGFAENSMMIQHSPDVEVGASSSCA